MDSKLKNIIARRFAALLDKCKMIALDMGVSYQCIYYILKGQNALSLARFIELCKAARLDPVKELKSIIAELHKEAKNDK